MIGISVVSGPKVIGECIVGKCAFRRRVENPKLQLALFVVCPPEWKGPIQFYVPIVFIKRTKVSGGMTRVRNAGSSCLKTGVRGNIIEKAGVWFVLSALSKRDEPIEFDASQ